MMEGGKDYETREWKDARVAELRAQRIEDYQLEGIDKRLHEYVTEVQEQPEAHNLYEVLAVLKFLRLLRTYEFRRQKVKRFVRLFEGLKFSGLDGRRTYRMTKVQYFQFASILGFYKWEKMKDEAGPDKKGRTWKVEDGVRYELRRLVREAILFLPRKFAKTTSVASLAVNDFLFGDKNSQTYTAANSYKQAKVCFDEISKIMKQLDPKRKYFKTTRETMKWRENKFGREGVVECLTGGGDTKDGLNASLVIFDEYAQARYVRDHSEGAELLQVLTSSMGTRREPLTIIITTASRVENGPFATELENAMRVLRGEYQDDGQFASLFMPDAWELDADKLGDEALWRKCNPHIGITVQESYYADRWKKAKRDAEAMTEFKTKLLNVFVSGGMETWLSQRLMQSLQVDFDIMKTKGRPLCMAAMDLSVSDDFSTVVYNVYSRATKKFYLWPEFFIPRATLNEHANSELYKLWVRDGWMKVCEGAVIDERAIVSDVLAKAEIVNLVQVGYDAYKAQEVVNSLRAAVAGRGSDADKVLKAVPQTYGAFTSPVETFEMAAKMQPPRVALSLNPILPYCFGNCYLDEDRMRNKKPIKRRQNLKIDGAVAALMTFWLYNNFEGL